MCLMAEALLAVGKLLTLQVLFGTKDLGLILLHNAEHKKDDKESLPGKILPVSSTFDHYLLTPSLTCLYYKVETNASVHLFGIYVNYTTSVLC